MQFAAPAMQKRGMLRGLIQTYLRKLAEAKATGIEYAISKQPKAYVKICDSEGCTTNAVARGKCTKHGGRGVCTVVNCNAMLNGHSREKK